MTLYFDFETTAATDNCFDPEQKKMFVMSYVLIVAFHPHLNSILKTYCTKKLRVLITTINNN